MLLENDSRIGLEKGKKRKEYLKKLTESLFTAGDINTLKEKYGITSQNETLEEIIEKYSPNHYHTRKR